MLGLSVVAGDGSVRCRFEGTDEVRLAWRGAYEPGDKIVLTADAAREHLVVKLDAALETSHVLLQGGRFEFPVPFGDDRKPYGAQAFTGERHNAFARVEDAREVSAWRNLALNAWDLTHADDASGAALFPHATTNVVPGNPQFIARNAIDGVVAPELHGSWPHASWGVAGRQDAWLQVEFGEPVVADELRLYLRADFPHDTCWEHAHVLLSDGIELVLDLDTTGERQTFDLGGRTIEWLRISRLKKRDEEGFPGLAQIEVWGRRGDE